MAKEQPTAAPPALATLADFLLGASAQKEMARAFADQMRADGVNHLPVDKWQRRLSLFQTKPTGTPWASWLAENGG